MAIVGRLSIFLKSINIKQGTLWCPILEKKNIYINGENKVLKILSEFCSMCLCIYDSEGYKKQCLSLYVFSTDMIYLSN